MWLVRNSKKQLDNMDSVVPMYPYVEEPVVVMVKEFLRKRRKEDPDMVTG